MFKYSFEKLDVWKRSRVLNNNVYKLSKSFPESEKYGLTSQIRRASVSISTNLAEGSSRISGIEQARFTEISYGSLLEVLNLIIIAVDLEYLNEDQLNENRPIIEEIGNKLNKLRQSQLNKSPNTKSSNKQ